MSNKADDMIKQMQEIFAAHKGEAEGESKIKKKEMEFELDVKIISGRWNRAWTKADHIMYKVELANQKGESALLNICNATLRNYKQILSKACDFGLNVDAEQRVSNKDQQAWSEYILPLFAEAKPRVTDPIDDYVDSIRQHKVQSLNADVFMVIRLGDIACFGEKWVLAQNAFYQNVFGAEKRVVVEAMIAALIKDEWEQITFDEVVGMCRSYDQLNAEDNTCDENNYEPIFDTFWLHEKSPI